MKKSDLNECKKKSLLPVPRVAAKCEEIDPFSKKLRRFDNAEIQYPFPNNCGVYINTNEHGVSEAAEKLANFPKVTEGFHIGFSGWHNFDIMAQRQSSRGLICDVNPENTLFMSMVLQFLINNPKREGFIEQVTDFIKKSHYIGERISGHKSFFGRISPFSIQFSLNTSEESPYDEHFTIYEEVSLEKKRESSWLYTDERYQHLRNLALNDKIVVITEDICSYAVFSAMKKLLIDNGIQVDTVYLSNIGEWMRAPVQREKFTATVNSLLMGSDTILVDARVIDPKECASPTQRCIKLGRLGEECSLNYSYFFESRVHQSQVEAVFSRLCA